MHKSCLKGGVCKRHGQSSNDGVLSEECTNRAVKGRVCMKHGAKAKRCSSDGCTNQVIKGGVCVKHGAKVERNDAAKKVAEIKLRKEACALNMAQSSDELQ